MLYNVVISYRLLPKERKMTLTELARLAYVSTSTASKAFSMSPEVSEQTRNMIFDIAKKHGAFKKFYRSEYPNCVIALICPEFDSSYYSALISAFQETLSSLNAELTVASWDFSHESIEKLLKYYDKYQTVDGIILINSPIPNTHSGAIPTVTVGRVSQGVRGDIDITLDQITAVREAVKHFKSAGVTDIGFIGDKYTGRREKNLRAAIREIIGEGEDIAVSAKAEERFEAGGYAAMTALIEKGRVPRAIVCAYDRIAYGVMRAAADNGIKIPEELLLVGFDDAPASAYTTPALSSINHSIKESAEAASRAIISKIRGEEYDSDITISCPLVIRESMNCVK